jgi:glutamine amidotransferase
MNVTVVDYKVGNIRSITNMLRLFKNVNVKVSNDIKVILKSDKLILPGVGAYGNAMNKIIKLELDDIIKEYLITGNSILGICLGMQLLMDSSEEFGFNNGLGLIPGKVIKISDEVCNILPNIGYYKLNFKDDTINSKFHNYWYYFIHSYQCITDSISDIESEILIDSKKIISSVSKDNIHGCQFHPEKSSEGGFEYFKSFLKQ